MHYQVIFSCNPFSLLLFFQISQLSIVSNSLILIFLMTNLWTTSEIRHIESPCYFWGKFLPLGDKKKESLMQPKKLHQSHLILWVFVFFSGIAMFRQKVS
jgi:hypothetical protein